jgi:hypothetical protein
MRPVTRRRLARRAAGGTLLAAALAGCGASGITATDATQFFRQAVAVKYNATVPAGGRRGCVKISSTQYSCTAAVTGTQVLNVIGTVTVSGNNMTTHAHQTTSAAIQAWLAKTGGAR